MKKVSVSQAVYLIPTQRLNTVSLIKMTDQSAIYIKLHCLFIT